MKYNTKLTYKIFWQHARKYKVSGLVLFASLILASVANLLVPLLYKDFFDILSSGGGVDGNVPRLMNIILYILLIYSGAWVFWRSAEFFNVHFQTRIMADLASTCFAYIHKHSFSFFQNNFVGSTVKKINRFYRAFEQVADAITWELTPIIVDVVWVSVILFLKNPLLGAISVVWVFFIILVNYLFSIYKLKYDIKRSEQDSKVTGVLADSVTNNVNIKLFCGYDRERKYFGDENNKLQELRRFTWNLASIFNAVQAIFMIGLEIGIMYFAVKLWQKGLVTIGDFVLIQSYIFALFNRFWNFGKIIRRFYEGLGDAEEMTEVLNTPHEIVDKKGAKGLNVKNSEIEFVNAKFNYNETRNILSDLSFKIKSKEKVALVGPSGAGKSTIVKLLLRMHDITSGSVLIDGQKISDVTQDSLWKNISLVPQEPILFHRSLMENIRYGKPEATDEEVINAAKLANCHNFIVGLSEGYNTFVGERGIKLSGGERQRVAIARAILRNAPILVLDEATSSLDSESEMYIQDALDKLMKNKTVIVIAHRLSTIMRMDRIIVIDEGKIIEDGKHRELIEKEGGLYKRLWEVQAGGFVG